MKNIAKKAYFILGVFLLTMVLGFLKPTPVKAATKKTLEYGKNVEITMVKGKTFTVQLKGTSIKKVSSSNSSVVKANTKGNVTASKNGKSKLTFSGANGKKYTCTVKVETPAISKKSVKLLKGKTTALKLNKNTQQITWTSSNKKIATVNSKGTIKAAGQGTAVITASVHTASYKCIVTVVNKKDTYTRGEWISYLMKQVNPRLTQTPVDYYFSDTKNHPYGTAVENANACGIILDGTVSGKTVRFNPDAAATREFAAVTSVHALGYALSEENRLSCADAADLKYPKEDYVAVSTGLLKLKNNKFLPKDAVLESEKKLLYNEIQKLYTETHTLVPKEETTYAANVLTAEKPKGKDYTITENGGGLYTIVVPAGMGVNTGNLSYGAPLVLPATETHPAQTAFIARTFSQRADGSTEIHAVKPSDMAQIVTSIDYAGQGKVIPEQITTLDEGVECSYIPQGRIAEQADAAYHIESQDAAAAYAVIGGEMSLPGKLHFTLKPIKLGNNGKVEGSFDLEIPNVTAKVNVDCGWTGIKVNESVVTITQKAQATANLKYAKASVNSQGETGTKELARIPFALGETGLSVDVVVSMFYDVKGNITISYTLETTNGIQYKNGHSRIISECNGSWTAQDVDASGKAGLKAALNVTAFGMWDIVGVYGSAGPGIEASAKNHDDVKLLCVDAKVYMHCNAGLNTETILGKYIKNNLHQQVEKTIFDKNNSPIKGIVHFENGKKVPKCTYKPTNPIDSSSVASIGEKGYKSLEDAYKAVKNGETILIRKPVVSKKRLLFNRGITFTVDCAGNQITTSGHKDPMFEVTSGRVTVANGNFIAGSQEDAAWLQVNKGAGAIIKSGTYKGHVHNWGSIEIENGTFKNSRKNASVFANFGSLTIKNGKFVSADNGNVVYTGESGKTTILKGTYQSTGKDIRIPVIFCSAPKGGVTIQGGTFTSKGAPLVDNEAGKVTLTNGTYTMQNNGNYDTANAIYNNGTMTISGGEYKVTDWTDYALIYNALKGNLKITGGKFTTKIDVGEGPILSSEGTATVNGGSFYGGTFFTADRNRFKFDMNKINPPVVVYTWGEEGYEPLWPENGEFLTGNF